MIDLIQASPCQLQMCEIVDCEYPAAQLLCDECKGEQALYMGKNHEK